MLRVPALILVRLIVPVVRNIVSISLFLTVRGAVYDFVVGECIARVGPLDTAGVSRQRSMCVCTYSVPCLYL